MTVAHPRQPVLGYWSQFYIDAATAEPYTPTGIMGVFAPYGDEFSASNFSFDYDAVEKLTDVKIRTNADREPGEETVPDWFFEDGVIFLPEELEYGMQFKGEYARRCFREENSDLLRVEYWRDVQQKLQRGEVPGLRMYPDDAKLPADAAG